MNNPIIIGMIILILGALPVSSAALEELAEKRICGVPLDPGVGKKILISPYAAAGMSFPWGALNFTGRPETNEQFAFTAGVRIAYPIVWFGGVIGGIEYAARPVSKTGRFPMAVITETRDLRFVNMLLGWRQYAWCFFYGTGVFAGVKAGPWRSRLEINGMPVNFGPAKPGNEGRAGFAFGLYTEVGIMFPLSERVTLDVTAQLQGSVTEIRLIANPFGGGGYRPMALLFIAGVSFRT